MTRSFEDMASRRPVDLTDPDNPEWTEADIARAHGPTES